MKTKKIVRTALAVLLSLLMALSCASIGVSAAGTVTITFNAYVPKGIPSDAPSGTGVSIGSILNGWDPRNTDWLATQIDSTHFQIKANVSADYIGQEVQYKWTLQRPDDTSKYGYGFTENYVGNRTFTVSASGNTLNDTVEFPEEQIVVDHTMSEGTLEEITLDMPQFSDNRSRKIRVWLPNGYNANDTGKKYSVLYMHDGQNLFDAYTSFLGEWQVDESMTELMDSGYESTIVVGIDNGEDKRFNELSPSWDLSSIGKNHISNPEGEKYAEFIVDTVKPYIDSHYNTYTDCAHTGVGGSSMGGIMSLYMAIEYADVFDYGLVLSPAMHAYNDDVLDKFFDSYNFDNMSHLPKLYLFAGGATEGSEAGSIYDEACITKYVDIIKNDLTERNYPAQIIGTNVDTSLCHLETTWAKVFPDAMTWVGNTASFTREATTTDPTSATTTEEPTAATTAPPQYFEAILGDVDLDGKLTIIDCAHIQLHAAKLYTLTDDELKVADVNKDGDINILDAAHVQFYIAELDLPGAYVGEKVKIEISATEASSDTTAQPTTTQPATTQPATTQPNTTQPSTPSEEGITVYLKNSAGWSSVYVGYWNETTFESSGFPGIEMTNVSGDIWSYTVPSGMDGLLFDDGTNSNQTANLEVPSQSGMMYDNATNSWSTYSGSSDQPTTQPSTQSSTEPSTPSADGITVYLKNSAGWSSVYVGYWNETTFESSGFPGIEMTNVSGDVWSYTVPSGMDGLLFDDGTNSNQTANLEVPSQNGMMYDNATNSWSTYSGGSDQPTTQPSTQSSTEPSTPSADGITVYLKNSAGWSSVYVGYWNETTFESSGFPGIEMTNVSGDIWSYTVPSGMDGLLFDDGTNSNQTANLEVPSQSGMMYDNATNSWSTYSGGSTGGSTGGTTTGDGITVYLKNSAGWSSVYVGYWNETTFESSGFPGIEMTNVSGDIWSYTVPSGMDGLLFDDGTNSNQTANLEVPSQSGMIYDNSANSWSTY